MLLWFAPTPHSPVFVSVQLKFFQRIFPPPPSPALILFFFVSSRPPSRICSHTASFLDDRKTPGVVFSFRWVTLSRRDLPSSNQVNCLRSFPRAYRTFFFFPGTRQGELLCWPSPRTWSGWCQFFTFRLTFLLSYACATQRTFLVSSAKFAPLEFTYSTDMKSFISCPGCLAPSPTSRALYDVSNSINYPYADRLLW